MFGLAQQIRCAHFRVNRVIGNHQRFRRTGKQIDTYPAEQLSFGLRDEGVTGADQHIDRCQRVRAQRHGAYRLNAAKGIDFRCASHFLRRDDRRGGLTVKRRGTADNS
ncbi:Uncharacterised protein [Klebsiella pneumoniae]|nr:Uncharacterised protein [Klebsiella pneumoniae]